MSKLFNTQLLNLVITLVFLIGILGSLDNEHTSFALAADECDKCGPTRVSVALSVGSSGMA